MGLVLRFRGSGLECHFGFRLVVGLHGDQSSPMFEDYRRTFRQASVLNAVTLVCVCVS